jgi:hypothetical protein
MPKRFRVRRVRAGRRFVFETDSQADYLRFLVDEMAGNFAVACDLSVTETADGWLRVEVKPSGPSASAAPGEKSEPNRAAALRFIEFADELGHIFSTFYECEGEERRNAQRAWKVRHRKECPWI